jgi:integrase
MEVALERIRAILDIARLSYRRWGWLSRPVYIELPPEHNQRHRYLVLAEVERLIDACDHEPTRDAVILAVYTGMRQGEIFALPQANVRGNCLRLDPPDSKNREPRLIPILPRMQDAVARLPLPCTARYMWGRFKRACARAELEDLTFHDLRHTTASLLINAGHSLKMVQEVLGHRSVTAANRYAHLSVETKRAALERVFGD